MASQTWQFESTLHFLGKWIKIGIECGGSGLQVELLRSLLGNRKRLIYLSLLHLIHGSFCHPNFTFNDIAKLGCLKSFRTLMTDEDFRNYNFG